MKPTKKTDSTGKMEVEENSVPIATSDRQLEDYLPKVRDFIKERSGVASAIAIKKHLKVKAKQRRIEFNNFLKLAIQNGDLEQVTGRGASGSFRLPKDEKKKKIPTKSDA